MLKVPRMLIVTTSPTVTGIAGGVQVNPPHSEPACVPGRPLPMEAGLDLLGLRHAGEHDRESEDGERLEAHDQLLLRDANRGMTASPILQERTLEADRAGITAGFPTSLDLSGLEPDHGVGRDRQAPGLSDDPSKTRG